MSTRYSLRISSAEGPLRVVPLTSRRTVIGRDPECEIQIADECVSRRHVELVRLTRGRFLVRDLDSRNPPRLGGISRHLAVIDPGDRFQLGSTFIHLTSESRPGSGRKSTSLEFGRDPPTTAITTSLPLEGTQPRPGSHDSWAAGAPGSLDSTRRFARLARLGEELAAAPSVGGLIGAALDGLMDLVPATRGFIGVGNPLEGEYGEVAIREGGRTSNPTIRMSRTVLERIFTERTVLLVRDSGELSGSLHDSVIGIGICSFAKAPLIVGEQFQGVVYLDSIGDDPRLDREHLEILKVVARLCCLALDNLETRSALHRENTELRGILERKEGMLGSSPSMQTVFRRIVRAGRVDAPVLILGETGTGKELAARSIHDQSERRTGPFIPFNCTLANESMIDSELFGHVRGAFTDAIRDHKGVFERAHGGTLFLDEIGDMPLSTQGKILRAVQEGRILPIGAEDEVEVDVRIISATHHDLQARQRAGLFREDLRYRLDVIRIELPPLRDRGEDAIEIARALLPERVEISIDAHRALRNHTWPGNVRELRNVVEQALFHTDGDRIRARDLPEEIARKGRAQRLQVKLPSLSELERRHIERVLEATRGNKTQAAEILGISRETLYQKIRAERERSAAE